MPAVEPATLSPEQLPHRFGRYELLRVLGEGGMGRVYEADLVGPAGFRKRVALKVLKAAARRMLRDLVREARLGGLMSHPNVVDTYDLGEHDRIPYVAMELVRGPTLTGLVRAGGAIPPRAAIELVLQVAAGLSHAHALAVGKSTGLIHRDLKPANILLTPEGLVKVADFGIAVLAGDTKDLGQSGTPGYMSPEQIEGDPLDGRSDLFALGIITWDILAGRRLIAGKGAQQRMMRTLRMASTITTDDFRAPLEAAVPGLADVVAGCLAVHRDERWLTAADYASALRTLPIPPGPGLAEVLAERGLGGQAGQALPSLTTGSHASATHTRPRAATNLGPEPDPFFGRERELDALDAWLRTDSWIALLKGPGGAGKTRLSRRFGRISASSFDGGTWFADLSECTDTDQVGQALAKALGVPASSDPEGGAIRALAGRGEALVILDNAEQIVSDVATLVRRIHAEAPETRLLVTSRERLKVRGEQIIPIGELQESDAVALFTARASERGWTPRDGDDAVIARLVERLDRMPLAIELAAARSRMMPVAAILERLEDRFNLLRGGQRGGPHRQSSLRAAIEGSWEVLEPWEQSVLAQCAVFIGGFTLEAAEEVVDLSDHPDAGWVMDAIESLLDRSLLVADAGALPRFRTYESIRAFASEQLSARGPEVEHAAWRRHAAWFARLGSPEAIQAWRGPEMLRIKQELVPEVDNLVAAVKRAIALKDSEFAEPLARITGTVVAHTGPWIAGRKLLTELRTTVPMSLPSQLAVAVYEADLSYRTGDSAALLAIVEHAEQQSQTDLDPLSRLYLTKARCFNYVLRAQWKEAEHYMGVAIELASSMQMHSEVAEFHRSIGMILARQGQFDEARVRTQEAHDLSRRVGDRFGTMVAGINLANIEKENGDLRRSADMFAALAREARELGQQRFEAMALGNLSLVLFEGQGAIPAAEDAVRRAIRINRAIGARATEALMRSNYGWLLADTGRMDKGDEQLAEAEAIAEAHSLDYVLAVILVNRAVCRVRRGDAVGARVYAERAVTATDTYGTPAAQGAAQNVCAEIAILEGDLDVAEAHATLAVELCGEDIMDGTRSLANAAKIALDRGQLELATSRLDDLADRVKRHGIGPDAPSAQLLARYRFLLRERTRAPEG